MAHRTERLVAGVTWVIRNLDVVIAVGLATTIGFLDVFADVVSDDVSSGATLLVLGTLALGSINQRLRNRDDIEEVLEPSKQHLADIAMVHSLSGDAVGTALRRARQETTRWCFKGGTGTYLRAVTLRECVARAVQERSHLTVKIEIVDPGNERACETYARFRRTFAPPRAADPSELWTVNRTRKESYATVLAACWYRQRTDVLEIDVHLSATAPTLRFDLSDSCLVITQDDQERPNLRVDRGQPLYNYYDTELRQSRDQARRLELRDAPPLGREPTVDEVRAVFDAVDLPLPSTFSDGDVGEIVEKALHAPDPYGR